MDNSSERRSSPRVRPSGDALKHVSLDMETQVVKLSTGGMQVELGMPVEIGSRHRFSIVLGGDELSVEGTVRNCYTEPALGSQVYTLGIAFDDLSPETHAKLEQFVAARGG